MPRRPFSVWLQESGSLAARELLEGITKDAPATEDSSQSSFAGLHTNPFTNASNPANLVLTRRTQLLFNELVQAIQDQAGLLLLTGEVGTGKTTLVNQLRAWLSMMSVPTAFLFNTLLDSDEFFTLALAEFGIRFNPATTRNAISSLHTWLRTGNRTGKPPVLIIDEAQSLSPSVLEALGLLLNWEGPRERLLQIVLVGQPELNQKLQSPELRKLHQRIAVRCTTAPFNEDEFRSYVDLRLRSGGWDGRPVFSEEALASILRYSQGIPRVINLLCEHALVTARGEGIRPVPARIVEEVARQFRYDDFHNLSPSPPMNPSTKGLPDSVPAPNHSIPRRDLTEDETDLEAKLGLTEWIPESTSTALPRAKQNSAPLAQRQKEKPTAELHPRVELDPHNFETQSSTRAAGADSRVWLRHYPRGSAFKLLAKCRNFRDLLLRWLQEPLSARRPSRSPRNRQA